MSDTLLVLVLPFFNLLMNVRSFVYFFIFLTFNLTGETGDGRSKDLEIRHKRRSYLV